MEESAEYDALLRSVFDSCDTAGTGLINASEFEELCSQLSLENESGLLSAFLFESTSLISYEKFKDGLLMLLNGSLSGNNDSSSNNEVFCDDRYLEEDLNDNNVKNRHSEKFGSEDDSDVGFGDVDDEKSWIVIDLKESNNSKARDKRKYGRRSKPDLELLGSREMMDTSTNQDSVIHVTSCVEYYADGDGSDWITPDIGPTLETPTCDSQLDAEQALGAIWLEVIGDLERSIDVDELQKLYQALSLTSSCGDVEQLF
uniref:EF-hand domain-containing protein n=1 Tax=Ciona savignyi TaxID=51511 RepID=H2ZFJ6_CIOSA